MPGISRSPSTLMAPSASVCAGSMALIRQPSVVKLPSNTWSDSTRRALVKIVRVIDASGVDGWSVGRQRGASVSGQWVDVSC